MNMFCYILGSGIMDKPYAVEIAISICVMMMFGNILYAYKNGCPGVLPFVVLLLS